MQAATFEEALEQILEKEKRYHRDAYLFLREALDHTRKILERDIKLQRTPGKRITAKEQHVSGQELLEGIRDLAIQNFGPMAMTVFEEWGVHSCQDFGELVFIMVENNLLKKTEKDSRADFENGYDFFEAFQKPYLPQSKQPRKPKAQKVTEA